jgi:NAD+ diphosphatase
VLIPALHPDLPSKGPALAVVVKDGDVAVTDAEVIGDVERDGAALFVGTLSGAHLWAVDANDKVPDGVHPGEFVKLMQLHGSVGESMWYAAGRAVQLVEWSRDHAYCGRCATPTEVSTTERSRRCPACGLPAFPRLAPAIITLVHRGDGTALLGRNARWPTVMFSTLAGFVEPGETVESAVRREVREEVGLQVGAVKYFGSQPWPFPHSLMLGFHASYAGGDIVVDGEEISEARWFAPDMLPAQIPGPISIARALIDDWLAGGGPV